MSVSKGLQTPIDLLRLAVNTQVRVKLRSGETLTGTLKGYDNHVNLLLVETKDAHIQFVRGDLVVLVSSNTHLY
jgi:small nuclear ribonucleoprotein (snRNP)-like protein